MKQSFSVRKTVTAILSFLLLTIAHAGTHLITFIPLTENHISVPANGVKIIKYQVTNHSKKTHTLMMQPITGISQITTTENCPNPFVLGSKQSCILSLQILGNTLQDHITTGPKVCEQGNRLMCYQPSYDNRLNITQGAPEYTISGTITGLTGTVTLLNNGAETTSISTDGSFTFSTPMVEGSTYHVTVGTQPLDQTCTVVSGSGIISSADINNITVTCSINTYTVGGTITGLTGTVTLLNNGADITSISTDGSFTFSTPIAEGSTYHVTLGSQPTHQTCTVASGSGTMGGANVTNVTVTCSTNTHMVSGTITGLNGTVTLLNNSINSTSLSTNGSFTFSTPIAEGSTYHVAVGTQPTEQTCTITNGSGTMSSSDVTNVTVNCVTNNTTLTVSAKGTIPVNSGSGSITVTNTGGTYAAYNVHAVLPGGWTGVTQDASGCATIAPHNGTCTLQFTSTTPYVAQGNITITGDNISSSPKTALAFTLNNYLVWSITGNTALVVASSDVSASQAWSTNFDILNITETSTNPPNACNSATDGSCNSSQLEAQYGTSYTDYAAGLCYEITSDNSGSVSPGTWYLPAICQMGNIIATCTATGELANIDTNLFKLGFGGFASGYSYWSSTEYGAAPRYDAWFHGFNLGTSIQNHTYKGSTSYRYVRCARAITF
ncbi:hypothetical protein [Legionella drancourtii]|uniref:DUF1566 domain-containing protein n=1 Tax=Legionella drancourtii LLAP12 TaxID=658187 RepID=G9EP06_9GAMM|nr:hypothetical protein [Legionella drancourtii]EHL30841.1 hypothetical protein LDG_6986 [Legionella drancourtii LLAP12]